MKYSIITPVYNREDSIGRCIDSVIKQLNNDVEIEHVIVDDGSRDRTAEIVKEYTSKYNHINFIQFPENRGTNAGRNAAIKAAKGEYCIILDSDDYFVDDAISTIDSNINSHPGYKHYMFAADDTLKYYAKMDLLKGQQEKELTFKDFLRDEVYGDFIHVMNTQVIRKYPFDEYLRIYEGVFFLRFYKEERRMMFINKVVAIRERSRTDSVSREYFKKSKEVIKRSVYGFEVRMKWFESDYLTLARERLQKYYTKYFDDLLRLGEYDKFKKQAIHARELGLTVPSVLNLLCSIKAGKFYYLLWKSYYVLRYDILKMKLG